LDLHHDFKPAPRKTQAQALAPEDDRALQVDVVTVVSGVKAGAIIQRERVEAALLAEAVEESRILREMMKPEAKRSIYTAPATAAPDSDAAAAAAAASTVASQPKKDEPKTNTVLFDTAAGASCVPKTFGQGLPERDCNTQLATATGAPIDTPGKIRELKLHTGKAVLSAEAIPCGVNTPILSAHEYCGPGGSFKATLDGHHSKLVHKATGTKIPLRWEACTLRLGKSQGKTFEAKIVKGKLIGATTAASTIPAIHTPGAARRSSSSTDEETLSAAVNALAAAVKVLEKLRAKPSGGNPAARRRA